MILPIRLPENFILSLDDKYIDSWVRLANTKKEFSIEIPDKDADAIHSGT